jgi:YVTN family beta-propeller protein
MPVWKKAACRFQIAHASARVLLLAPVLVFVSWITGSVLPAGAFHPKPQGFYSGPPRPSQSSPIALSGDDVFLVNVNPDVNTVTIFLSGGPNRIGEVSVGSDPVSVAIHPSRPVAYVANSQDGTLSVVDLPARQVLRTVNVGAEPSAVAFSPNGTRLYVANSSSNNLMVINPNNDATIATVDLSPFGTAPRAIGVTNDGDNEDSDETIFVPLFFAGLRAGKTATEESQDDQREGRVVAISAASNSVLAPNPVLLQPLIDTGFNSNGRLSPGPGQVPNEESFNPQTFLSRTDAFPNQLAAIAIHPSLARAYVVSTGASPNGPFRFNSNSQGLVSVFDTETRLEVTAPQTGADVRRQAPLNLNRGVNLDTALEPRLFFSNPVAMAWRPDGSDAWIVVQNSDVIVRLTVNPNGIPTIGAPLAPGPGQIVRVDLVENLNPGEIAGTAPKGIVIDGSGSRAFIYNFTSRTVSVIDISNPTLPTVVATRNVSEIPVDATVQLGATLFHTGRGPQGRMAAESWGGCVVCHPNGRTDNVTWMFDAGPRQTIPLDGMFNKANFHDQRVLNWSAVRDSNQDFELNTRGVFGGRGLIDDDRLFLAIGGASNTAPIEQTLIEQFQQLTGAVSTTNDLLGNTQLPQLDFADLRTRRDFAVATLDDARVFIIGGRVGPGQGTLVGDEAAVLEFNPRTNELLQRSSIGFTRRHSLGAAAVKTAGGFRIYAIGGYDSTEGSAAPVNTVEEYNPNTGTWRTVASLPTAVAQYGIAVAGGVNTAEPRQLIHVVSGNTGSEGSPSVANPNPVQRFQADPAGSGVWSTFALPQLTLRRNHGAAAILRVVSSRVFVIGGQDAAGTALTSVQEYQAQAVTFVDTPHTSLPAARARFGIGSTLTSNQIYVMGGVDAGGADQSTIFELTTGANGPVPGPKGTPSGVWVTRGNLSAARRGLQVTTPPGVTNFLPVQSAGRDPRQDAIAVWIAQKVRTARAPVPASDASAANGRTLFGQVGLVVPGFSCASCHGGPKWTRSTVDYTEPPSPEVGLGLGNERVIGAELRQTLTQGPNVLINVGTFTLGGGRTNEIRFSGADISQAIAPLGANGFNIPSLLSVHETAPYFYSGLAQTLEEVLNGSQDSFGGVRHHFVLSPAQRADLIEFLRSVDDTTPIFP